MPEEHDEENASPEAWLNTFIEKHSPSSSSYKKSKYILTRSLVLLVLADIGCALSFADKENYDQKWTTSAVISSVQLLMLLLHSNINDYESDTLRNKAEFLTKLALITLYATSDAALPMDDIPADTADEQSWCTFFLHFPSLLMRTFNLSSTAAHIVDVVFSFLRPAIEILSAYATINAESEQFTRSQVGAFNLTASLVSTVGEKIRIPASESMVKQAYDQHVAYHKINGTPNEIKPLTLNANALYSLVQWGCILSAIACGAMYARTDCDKDDNACENTQSLYLGGILASALGFYLTRIQELTTLMYRYATAESTKEPWYASCSRHIFAGIRTLAGSAITALTSSDNPSNTTLGATAKGDMVATLIDALTRTFTSHGQRGGLKKLCTELTKKVSSTLQSNSQLRSFLDSDEGKLLLKQSTHELLQQQATIRSQYQAYIAREPSPESNTNNSAITTITITTPPLSTLYTISL